MLHVLLLILKVLGLTLLIILGIILLIIILILVAPFRYTFDGEYYEDFSGNARIRWLIFVLDLKAQYNNKTFLYYLRSFGSLVSTNDDIKPGFMAKVFNWIFSKFRRTKPEDVPVRVLDDDLHLDMNETSLTGNNEDIMASSDSANLIEKIDEDNPPKKVTILDRVNRIVDNIRRIPEKIYDFLTGIEKRIRAFFKNTRRSVKRFLHNLKGINEKKDDILDFLKDSNTKEAFSSAKKYALSLLKHIKPRKLNGYLKFGFDEPDTTGKLLGVVAMMYPLYKDCIHVYPDFEQRVFEGQASGKGRVRLGFLLILILRIIQDKNLITTFNKGMSIVGGN